MGGLYLPCQAPWLDSFEHEMLRFPSGVHDDQVDALGLIGQLLDHIQAPAALDQEEVIDLKPGDYEFALDDEDEEDEDRVLDWKVL